MFLDDNPYEGLPDAGPQDDGTYVSPVQSVQPSDAGGGAPATYNQNVLDVFRWGVGVWQAREGQKDMLDYKRWEAVNGGIAQQGRSATGVTAGQRPGGIPQGALLLGAAVLAVVLLAKD